MTRIAIFAKEPRPGRVKTRLIPALGADGAARLARAMLEIAVEEALASGLAVDLCGDPDAALWHESRTGLVRTGQGDGDLGERLARAVRRTLGEGEPVLLIGTDCPALDRDRLRAAATALRDHDSVIHPTLDGGYALLGLRRFDPTLFEAMEWSTPAVAERTVERVRALGWTLHVAETLRDVDEPADLAHAASCRIGLESLIHREGNGLPPDRAGG